MQEMNASLGAKLIVTTVEKYLELFFVIFIIYQKFLKALRKPIVE